MFAPAPDHSLTIKSCQKFNQFNNLQKDSKSAIVYLKLRKIGCPKKQALKFTHKGTCRVDSTQHIDGPQQFRQLKRQKINSLKVKNGWLYDTPDYDLGSEYRQDANEIIQEDSEDEKLIENINAHKEKKRKNHQSNTDQIAEYYEQLDKEFEFFHNESDIVERNNKILDLVQKKTIDLRTRKYFIENNQRYSNLAEELYDFRLKENPDNIILKENPFNNIVLTEDIKGKQIYQENDEQLLKYSAAQQQPNSRRSMKNNSIYHQDQQELQKILKSRGQKQQVQNPLDIIMERQEKIQKLNQDWKQLEEMQNSKEGQQSNNNNQNIKKKHISFEKNTLEDKIKEFNDQQYIFNEKQKRNPLIQDKKLIEKMNQEEYMLLMKKFHEQEQQFKSVWSQLIGNFENKKKEKKSLAMYNTDSELFKQNNDYFKNLDNLCKKSEQNWEKFISRNLQQKEKEKPKPPTDFSQYKRKYIQSSHTSALTTPNQTNRKSFHQMSTNPTTKRNSIHNNQQKSCFSQTSQSFNNNSKLQTRSVNVSPNNFKYKSQNQNQFLNNIHAKKKMYYKQKFTNYNIKELTKDENIIKKIQEDKLVGEAFEQGYQQSLQNILQYNSFREQQLKFQKQKLKNQNKSQSSKGFKIINKYVEHQLSNLGHKLTDRNEKNSNNDINDIQEANEQI